MAVGDGYNTDGFYHLNFGWGENLPDPITTVWYSLPDYEVYGYHMIREAIVDIDVEREGLLTTNINQINLGGCFIGETSEIKSFNLNNKCDSTINVRYILPPKNFDISLSTQNFADSLFDIQLLPSESKEIYIQCNPDSIGTFEGDLIIKFLTNASKYITIDLKGYGIPSGGTILNNENVSGILEKSKSPYHICGNLIIDSGNILIIEPGVKLIFRDHYHLRVKYNAQLSARGTEQDSIIFTALDKKIGWGGIVFQQSKDDSLVYCVIEYGNADLDYEQGRFKSGCGGGIFINGSDPTIIKCSIRKNFASARGGGIYISNIRDSVYPKIPKIIQTQIIG